MALNGLHRGHAVALLAAVVSGFAVFVNGMAVRRFDDATVYTTAKNLVAGAILTGVLLARRRMVPVASEPDTPLPRLGLIALVGGAVPFVLFFEGLARASSTNAAFIHKTLVIWVAIGATVVLREQVTAVHVAAIAALLAGYLLVAGGLPTPVGAGELMILIATLLWATEVVLVKQVLPNTSPDLAAVSRMAGGSALLVLWLIARGDVAALSQLSAWQWAWLALTGSTLSVFVATWYHALAKATAIDVTSILVLGAVITGLLNAGFRGVPLADDTIGYALLAIGAAAIIGVGRRTPQAAPA